MRCGPSSYRAVGSAQRLKKKHHLFGMVRNSPWPAGVLWLSEKAHAARFRDPCNSPVKAGMEGQISWKLGSQGRATASGAERSPRFGWGGRFAKSTPPEKIRSESFYHMGLSWDPVDRHLLGMANPRMG